ncbi:hypothetical protein TNCV_2441601 [Trichonephila clavipes]|nr:hypothetical protein TNCV_2441601 [Trichonephila clavipes]
MLIKQLRSSSLEGKHRQHIQRSTPHNYNGRRAQNTYDSSLIKSSPGNIILFKRVINSEMLLQHSTLPLTGRKSEMRIYNKMLLYTAVLRIIITYGSPVWGYAADASIKFSRLLRTL